MLGVFGMRGDWREVDLREEGGRREVRGDGEGVSAGLDGGSRRAGESPRIQLRGERGESSIKHDKGQWVM